MAIRPVPAAGPPPALDLVRLRSAGLVLLAGTCWSTGGVLVRLVDEADARQIVLWRSLFIGLFVASVLLLRRCGDLLGGLRAVGWNGVLGGLCLAGAFVGFVEALTRTTVANAVFLLAAQPLLAALFARLLLGERVSRTTWLAMLTAAAGIAVMMAPGLRFGDVAGSLMALGAALGFALFSVSLRRGRHGDTTPSILYAALFSATGCALLLASSGGIESLLIPPWDLLLCAVMGIGQIGCGMLAFAAGSRHLTAAELGLLALSEVVLGPVWAWLALGEIPASSTLMGGALVLAAAAAQAIAGAAPRSLTAGQGP